MTPIQITTPGTTLRMAATFKSAALLLTALFLAGVPAQAQKAADIDLDSYYHAPAALGVSYLPLSAIGNRELSDFSVYEIAGEISVSPKGAPKISPFVTGGLMNFTFSGDIETALQDWTHFHVFAGPGLSISSRISREFQLGVKLFAAGSQSFFPNLTLPDSTGPYGQLNVLGGASAKLALNPSYKLSLAVEPSLRYLYGLGPLDRLNGMSFGVGFGANYRFGQDPDAPQSSIRAIRFAETRLPPRFAAMQSYYSTTPSGTVGMANGEKYPLTDIEISFFQAGFMDAPTACGRIDRLGPGEKAEIPLLASYNEQVFSTQGVTPLNGEIIVAYIANGKPVEQRQTVSYDLYDRNALTWDDDRKAAAFITPQDSAVRNYASHIRQVHKDAANPYLSANLQFAMQAFGALAELGMFYQVDPTSPFTDAQESALLVDSISLPRETLARRTGDCDDLTVLFSAMLQTVGIPTALVTIPGHIYTAFNTGVPSRSYRNLHPDRNMFIEKDGELWVLVEITLIGNADFLKAWNMGVSEFRKYDNDTKARGFYPVAEAQELYRPVSLRETDLGLQYGDPTALQKRFAADMDRLAATILTPKAEKAKASGLARDWNAYGAAAAQLGATAQARSAFDKALQLDPANLNSRLNVGSVLYLENKFTEALAAYEKARSGLAAKDTASSNVRANLLINLAQTYHALGRYAEASASLKEAGALNPELAGRFDHLASADAPSTPGTGTSSGRASQAAAAEPILFSDE